MSAKEVSNRQSSARFYALKTGRVAPCISCGAKAAFIHGERPRCKACMLVRVRPGTEIDPLIPWEQDAKARRIVSEFGALSRPTVAALMGVTPEAIRLVETRVVERLRGAFEAAGIDGGE